jgi:c-di-GMP-related signal transduction protein
MAELLAQLAVSPAIQRALLHGDGQLGQVYSLVRAYERSDWEHVGAVAAQLEIVGKHPPTLYGKSLQWADRLAQGAPACA